MRAVIAVHYGKTEETYAAICLAELLVGDGWSVSLVSPSKPPRTPVHPYWDRHVRYLPRRRMDGRADWWIFFFVPTAGLAATLLQYGARYAICVVPWRMQLNVESDYDVLQAAARITAPTREMAATLAEDLFLPNIVKIRWPAPVAPIRERLPGKAPKILIPLHNDLPRSVSCDLRRVLRGLLAIRPDLSITITHDRLPGPLRYPVEELARQHAPRINLLSGLGYEAFSMLCAQHTLMLSLQDYETFNLAVQTAIACDLPTLCSDISPFKSLRPSGRVVLLPTDTLSEIGYGVWAGRPEEERILHAVRSCLHSGVPEQKIDPHYTVRSQATFADKWRKLLARRR